jgi:hypothetical protein
MQTFRFSLKNPEKFKIRETLSITAHSKFLARHTFPVQPPLHCRVIPEIQSFSLRCPPRSRRMTANAPAALRRRGGH